jgi:hypothetical protein
VAYIDVHAEESMRSTSRLQDGMMNDDANVVGIEGPFRYLGAQAVGQKNPNSNPLRATSFFLALHNDAIPSQIWPRE